jgi:hypothetical protein
MPNIPVIPNIKLFLLFIVIEFTIENEHLKLIFSGCLLSFSLKLECGPPRSDSPITYCILKK